MTTDTKAYPGYRGLAKGATGKVSSSPLVMKLVGNRAGIIRRPR